MAFRNSILAGEELVRTGIRSSNYAAGAAGWRVDRDGNAEFNDVIIRGDLQLGTLSGPLVMTGPGAYIATSDHWPRVVIAGDSATIRLEQANDDPIDGTITAVAVLAAALVGGVPQGSLSSGVLSNLDFPALFDLISSDIAHGAPSQAILDADRITTSSGVIAGLSEADGGTFLERTWYPGLTVAGAAAPNPKVTEIVHTGGRTAGLNPIAGDYYEIVLPTAFPAQLLSFTAHAVANGTALFATVSSVPACDKAHVRVRFWNAAAGGAQYTGAGLQIVWTALGY